MAQSGHTELHRTCPLSGAKPTCPFALHMSANDPKRTWRPNLPSTHNSSHSIAANLFQLFDSVGIKDFVKVVSARRLTTDNRRTMG